MAKMKTWWVFGKMNQCFDGFLGDLDAPTKEEALADAFDLACENYDSFAGLHGIQSREDIEEEILADLGEVNDEDVNDRYCELVSDNVYYWVMEAIPGEDPEDYADQEPEED